LRGEIKEEIARRNVEKENITGTGEF